MLKGTKGFTLIEILIVLVVLAALAALVIPGYVEVVEKSRKQEALQGLAALRDSQMRHFALKNIYTMNFTDLDFNPNSTAVGAKKHFDYKMKSADDIGFEAVATRNTHERPANVSDYTITINEGGTITSTF